MRSRLIEPLVFTGGLTSIGIELTTSRLLAPYFGSSTFIWANLIGLTLSFLALGYYLGGRVADRHPDPRILYGLAAVAAVSAAAVPLVAGPILDVSLEAFDRVAVGAFYGSLVGTIALIAIPITLLGFVTPFAIRLRIHSLDGAGQTAGRIYALSTIGSILGSFLPVLVFIPLVGTRATFLILSGLLLTVALAGLVESCALPATALAAVAGVAVAVLSVTGSDAIKPPYRGTLLYEAESEYNYIQVLDDDGRILLALNEGHAIHSIYDPASLLTGGPWDYFMIAPLFNEEFESTRPYSALMIGLAGGTAARQLLAAYPAMIVDGVEIDEAVADAGRDYFAMEDPRLNVIIEDGRYFIRTTGQTYDIIGVDAYRQPYIPFQLTTREFFTEIRSALNSCGVAVVNVGRTDTDYRLVDAIASTMRDVFPAVFRVDVERYTNTMVIGVTCAASISAFERNVAVLPAADALLRPVGEAALATGNPASVEPGGRVFTDDHAPVELVVDLMIVDAALEENE